MLKPDYLKPGDLIRIVSPAGKVAEEKIGPSVELLHQSGFEVLLGNHVFDDHFQFGGTDEQRLCDLQQAFDDPYCKAIICSRGGYGTIRIVEKLNLRGLHKYPKWLVGFSDNTILHALLQKEGFCSVHGAMPAFYLKDGKPTDSYIQLIKTLKGEKVGFTVPVNPFNRRGQAKGQLVGGNLSLLYSLMATPFEPETHGKILFIEDVSEYLYHIDRMMHSLKLAGKLEKLNGLMVGGFTSVKDNEQPFGQCVEEIIINAVKDYEYPVCFDFPSGHIDSNMPLMLGEEYLLTVTSEEVSAKPS